MNQENAFYNHSQMEEFRLSQTPDGRKILYEKRLGLTGRILSRTPLGTETPLGHAYSVFLQKAYEDGVDIEPNPQEMIKSIQTYWNSSSALEGLGLANKLVYSSIARGFANYVRSKGVSEECLGDMMEELLGQRLHEFSPELNNWRYKRQ